jgi:hypothetical protein
MIHEETQGEEESAGRRLSQEASKEPQEKTKNTKKKKKGKPKPHQNQQQRQLTSLTTRIVES